MIGQSSQVALYGARDLVENVDRRKGSKTWLFSLTHFSRHCRDQGGIFGNDWNRGWGD